MQYNVRLYFGACAVDTWRFLSFESNNYTTNYLGLVIWRSCPGRRCRPSSVFWTSARFWACRAIWGSGSSSRGCTRSPAGRRDRPCRWPWSVSSDSSCCPRLLSVCRGTPRRWSSRRWRCDLRPHATPKIKTKIRHTHTHYTNCFVQCIPNRTLGGGMQEHMKKKRLLNL